VQGRVFRPAPRYPESLLYLLFFLSGISGLIYQVVWVRVFGNVFGNTVYSASLVVAVFMLGLGVGSYLAGRWADRRYAVDAEMPLRLYGYFELVIAAMGAAIALTLPHLDRLSVLVTSYQRDANGWYVITAASYAARVAIAAGLLTPITLLMGGTLTLLIRYLVRADVEAQSRRIAVLYAVNTAGAAAGCFLTDFTLVPSIGLLATQIVAVLLNAIAGVGAIALGRLKPAPTTSKSQITNRKLQRGSRIPAPGSRPATALPMVAMALALSGFAGLGMEILWFRHFSMMLGAFRAVFSLLLTIILVGIGAGSFISSALQRRTGNAGAWLLGIQSLFIVFTLAGMWGANSALIDQTVSTAINAKCIAPIGVRGAVVQHSPDAAGGDVAGAADGIQLSARQHARPACGARRRSPGRPAVSRQYRRRGVRQPRLGLSVAAVVGSSGKHDHPGDCRRYRISPSVSRYSNPEPRVPNPDGGTACCRRHRHRGMALPAVRLHLQSRAAEARAERTRARSNRRRQRDRDHHRDDRQGTAPDDERPRDVGDVAAVAALHARARPRALLMTDNPERVLVIGFGVGNTTAAATLHPSVQHVEVADLSRNVLNHAGFFDGRTAT
jgi:MFS family permease